MITAEQIFERAMDLMDKRNKTGAIDPTKTLRYKVRTPNILTQWQTEMSKQGDLYNTFEISNTPITNLLGMISGFDIQEFKGTDLYFEGQGQARAYYFEVDNPGIVYIEDYTSGWNTLATITVPDTVTSFTAYKGLVTPTSGATKSRIRASGTYYYRIINRALYDIPFQSDRIPDYKPWVKHQMPDDYKSVDQIINEYPDRQYQKDSTFKWEGRKDLYINYYYVGKVRIVYKPIPVPITDLTQILEVDDITAETAAYFLSAHLLLVEDPASASFFNERFIELKAETSLKQPASIQDIVDIYGMNGGVYGGDYYC